MTNSKTYRIVIIEPYSIIAQGLRLMIEDIRGFEVCAIIADGHYMERITSLRPDIVVINPTVIDLKRGVSWMSLQQKCHKQHWRHLYINM